MENDLLQAGFPARLPRLYNPNALSSIFIALIAVPPFPAACTVLQLTNKLEVARASIRDKIGLIRRHWDAALGKGFPSGFMASEPGQWITQVWTRVWTRV